MQQKQGPEVCLMLGNMMHGVLTGRLPDLGVLSCTSIQFEYFAGAVDNVQNKGEINDSSNL